MKTKIRSFIFICTLGLVGVLNANAALSYNTLFDAETNEKQNITKSVNSNSAEFAFIEDADVAVDYQMEARLVTKWIADNEETKTIQLLIDKGIFALNDETDSFTCEAKSAWYSAGLVFNENADAAIDYQKEALLVTKWIADNEEAKAVQKLVDEGKLAENK